MKIQLLSDLHLETESFDPQPAPGAELLLLAGDIDANWTAYERFRGWPQPVIVVAGNHEFDGRELSTAWPALRERCASLGLTLMERESRVLTGADGRRIRFVATTRWSDFDLFGEAKRPRAMRAAGYFMSLMGATRGGAPFDVDAVRDESLACRDWLAGELAVGPATADGGWDATVAVTHFAPSIRSADPRYGKQPGTASFCNDDEALLPRADVWVHGHLHCRHDYRFEHPGHGHGNGNGGNTRVLCNARGHARKGEADGYPAQFVFDV